MSSAKIGSIFSKALGPERPPFCRQFLPMDSATLPQPKVARCHQLFREVARGDIRHQLDSLSRRRSHQRHRAPGPIWPITRSKRPLRSRAAVAGTPTVQPVYPTHTDPKMLGRLAPRRPLSRPLRLRAAAGHQSRTSLPRPRKENRCAKTRSSVTLWESPRFKSGRKRLYELAPVWWTVDGLWSWYQV